MTSGGQPAKHCLADRWIGVVLACSLLYALILGEALTERASLRGEQVASVQFAALPAQVAVQGPSVASHTAQPTVAYHAWADAAHHEVFSAQDPSWLGMSAVHLIDTNMHVVAPGSVPYLLQGNASALSPPMPKPYPALRDDLILVYFNPEPPERPPTV